MTTSPKPKAKYRIKYSTWMCPGAEQTLDDLLTLAPLRGWVILSVDREQNRLLISEVEVDVG